MIRSAAAFRAQKALRDFVLWTAVLEQWRATGGYRRFDDPIPTRW